MSAVLGYPCLVPRPHCCPRLMRFGLRGPREAVRLGHVTELMH